MNDDDKMKKKNKIFLFNKSSRHFFLVRLNIYFMCVLKRKHTHTHTQNYSIKSHDDVQFSSEQIRSTSVCVRFLFLSWRLFNFFLDFHCCILIGISIYKCIMRKREKFNGNICNNNENYTFCEISTCERLINYDHDPCTHTQTLYMIFVDRRLVIQ